MIDHAWGLEPCGMAEIKAYKPSTNSLSEGQVLAEPYPYDKARIIVAEMADSLVLQLTDKNLVTDGLTLDVGYDRENCDKGSYRGPVHIDHYGRSVPKGAHGSTHLGNPTNLGSTIVTAAVELFDRIGQRRGMLLRGGEIDYERVSNMLLDEFRGGLLGRITVDFIPGERA